MDEPRDEELYIRWCRSPSTPEGNEAWECLYERHRENLVLYCASLTRDWASAEDCAEEAFARLMPPRQLQDSFRAYLWRTARNIATDHARKASHAPLIDDPASTDCDPARRLAAAELSSDIARCLDRLEPKNRELVLLKACDHFTFEEAGRILCLSRAVSTLKSAYDKALALLRKCLEKVAS